jgi:hypothetical protein
MPRYGDQFHKIIGFLCLTSLHCFAVQAAVLVRMLYRSTERSIKHSQRVRARQKAIAYFKKAR